MEGLIKRTYVVVALAAATGILVHATARAGAISRTESWMEKTAIKGFGPWEMRDTDFRHPQVSYKMNEASYKELVPYGIVARVLDNGKGDSIDTVLIASSNKASFHDPRVCFTAQGWEIRGEETVKLSTATRGEIPVTLATMFHKDQGERPAIYFYRGPAGFAPTTTSLKVQMLKVQVIEGRNPEGVFYRFMPVKGVTTDELKKFVGDYMDASGKATGNYF